MFLIDYCNKAIIVFNTMFGNHKWLSSLNKRDSLPSKLQLKAWIKFWKLKIEKDDLMLFKRSPFWHYSAYLIFKNFSNLSQTNTNTRTHFLHSQWECHLKCWLGLPTINWPNKAKPAFHQQNQPSWEKLGRWPCSIHLLHSLLI